MFNLKYQTFLSPIWKNFEFEFIAKSTDKTRSFLYVLFWNVNVIYMSHSDYSGAVASGVQNMKNNEFSKLTNPINQQIDGFQTDIEGLQKSLADQSASLGSV